VKGASLTAEVLGHMRGEKIKISFKRRREYASAAVIATSSRGFA
jgi:ribosomal protein L21